MLKIEVGMTQNNYQRAIKVNKLNIYVLVFCLVVEYTLWLNCAKNTNRLKWLFNMQLFQMFVYELPFQHTDFIFQVAMSKVFPL